jgi:hypothetical protein
VIAEYRHAISLLKAFLKREYCGQEKEHKNYSEKLTFENLQGNGTVFFYGNCRHAGLL